MDDIPNGSLRPIASPDAVINQRIFDTTIDLILVTDRTGRFVRVSPSSSAILGYHPSEMVGRLATMFLYPEDLENTREQMRLARRGGVMRNFECRYVHKDGSIVHLSWTGVWNNDARQHFFIGRDVTLFAEFRQLKLIEGRLRELSANLENRLSWKFILRMSEVYVTELTLTACSIWASLVLFSPPSNFITNTVSFQFIESLSVQEHWWAGFAATAAAVKIVGLGAALMRVSGRSRLRSFGKAFRSIGLAMSGTFWSLMGLSMLVGNPDSLFGFPGLLMGVLAWWGLVRIITNPD